MAHQLLTLLALLAAVAAAAGAALARAPAVRRGAARMSDRQLGAPSNPYVSKSPQQQQYEAQQRAAAQARQMSPADRKRQQYKSRVLTGSSKDVFLQSSWFDKAKGGLVGLALAAALGGAGWQGVKVFKGRQEDLIDALADSLVYKGKSTAELKRTLKSYEKQLGPGAYKARIMAKYISALSTARPTSAETILSFQAAQAVLGIAPAAMPGIIAMAAETHLADRPSVLGKLLFLAERAVSPAAAAPLRAKLPYGPEYVDSLQAMMLEKAFKAAVLAKAEDLASAAVPAEYATLGLSQDGAAQLLAKFVAEEAEERRRAEIEADEALSEERARLDLAQALVAEIERERKPFQPEEPQPADAPVAGKALECSNCGYMLFPAAGREFKFYGDDFKCPQCGAGKDSFTDTAE